MELPDNNGAALGSQGKCLPDLDWAMFGKKTLRKLLFSWQKSDGDGAKEKTSENLEEVRKEIEINPTEVM